MKINDILIKFVSVLIKDSFLCLRIGAPSVGRDTLEIKLKKSLIYTIVCDKAKQGTLKEMSRKFIQ